MKINQLMDAIEQIDDRFVEEAAYGVRRKTHIPWGLISAAACFCLVIGAAMLMQSMGILPHLSGTSDPTTQSITTEPSDTTEPTWSMAEYKERRAIQALFSEKDNWYCRALVAEFDSPENLPLRYYFYNSIEFGEGLQPTKEEMDELIALQPDGGMPTLVILPVSKMDAVLTEVFDITVAEMESKAFAGMKYVESIDSWCFWSSGILHTPEMVEDTLLPTVYVSGNILRFVCRTATTRYVMRLECHGDTYRILSNAISQSVDEEYPELAEFFQIGSWKHRALLNRYSSPAEADIQMVLCRSYEGEQVVLSDFEEEALQEMLTKLQGQSVWRMTEDQINEILLSCWNVTLDMVEFPVPYHIGGDEYVSSVYLEETGCWYGPGGYRGTESEYSALSFLRVEEANDGILNMYYMMPSQNYPAQWLARLKRNETGYYVLSVEWADWWEKPDETTVPTEPPKTRPSVEEFFSDREKWQNHLILATFSDPTQIDLRPYYLPPMNGESLNATALEHEKLSTVISGYDRNKLFRATKAQLDEIMLTLFNITTDQLTTDWESNFTYLEETGCYYSRAEDSRGYRVYIGSTEECEDGTILMYYSLSGEGEPDRVAKLQPHKTGYYILSNEQKDTYELRTKMEKLFKAYGWFNQALTCEYDSPEQIGIMTYFYMGLENNKQVSDEEKEQLKNMQGFSSPAGDIYRLPPDKMNPILEECFGITLEDLDPTAFNGLAYLESTDCYYFKASAPNGVENFKAYNVEKQSDGTIDVYYNISYMGDYVVTVKPHGDGYRVLSNRCINSTPSIPQTPVEPTGDTELEKLFAGYWKVPEKEAAQKMVDAFLADPDTFVKLLAKQSSSRAILGVLSRNVTDHHSQIRAYRAAVSTMLAKELPENEKTVVYGMAVYSGLSSYISAVPAAADYRFVLDVSRTYTYDGETLELLRKFCIEDAAGMIEVLVQDQESQTIYIARITALASQEELEQIKESVTNRKEELSKMDGEGIQEQKNYAMDIIASCNERLK